MSPTEIARKAVERLNLRITDEVFLEIQKHTDFLDSYFAAVKEKGRQQVNAQIAQEVGRYYDLVGLGEGVAEPKNILAKDCQQLARRS